MIDKLHPKAIRRRTASLQPFEDTKLLQEFEEFGEAEEKTRESETAGGRQDRLRKGFVWGVLTTLGLVFVSGIINIRAVLIPLKMFSTLLGKGLKEAYVSGAGKWFSPFSFFPFFILAISF